MKAKYYWLGVLSTLLVVGILSLGILVVYNTKNIVLPNGNSGQISGNLQGARNGKWLQSKIRDIDRQLDQRYINQIDRDQMYEAALKGYVDALGDPYTVYLSPQEYEAFNQGLSGTYEGIGVPIEKDAETKGIIVIAPYKDSPGEKAGLRAGDIIVAVDGEDITTMDADEAAAKIRGKKGTEVVLTVHRKVRNRVESMDFAIIRDEVIIPTIEAKMLEDEIGYIAIFGFDEPTADQFSQELSRLKAGGMKGLVIDLRGNPGGYLETANEIVDEIMLKGLVVYIEDKNGNREDFHATNSRALDLPMAVLVNQGSASASEILAGALKDHKLATIVGTTSFGKGLVQNTVPFLDGSALKVTIARYYTPDGNYIHGKGIEPDVVVELAELAEGQTRDPDKMDNQLEKAWQIVKDQLK